MNPIVKAISQLFKGSASTKSKSLAPVASNRGTWYPMIRESFAGAWQANIEVDLSAVPANHAVFSCQTLIASDISKLAATVQALNANGVWEETDHPANAILARPNPFQNRIQFIENWILSKLSKGNSYILLMRDANNSVGRMYVLDPTRVQPMVSESGVVFYRLLADNIAGIQKDILVPASEIIHDRMNCLFHPLVGVSPIFACGLAATQGLAIQKNSTWFFSNRSAPGGTLTTAGHIPDETAERLKKDWTERFTGENIGKVAILGDGLKYEPLGVAPDDAQLIEQLKLSAEIICSTFHVPAFKIGLGAPPPYTNVQSLNVEYYSQGLQYLIEALELCLSDGLGLNARQRVNCDTDTLLRMDSETQMKVYSQGITGSILAPDEARRKLGYNPVPGGASPLAQQQQYSLAALAKRDALPNPFGTPALPAPSLKCHSDTYDPDSQFIVSDRTRKRVRRDGNDYDPETEMVVDRRTGRVVSPEPLLERKIILRGDKDYYQ